MTILTDSMAREHQAEIIAMARENHRAREARLARREQRRSQRRARRGAAAGTGGAGNDAKTGHAGLGRVVVRPLAAAQHWLVAGQL
ncbi:hypothetical protein [Jatrophihabitans fulvus]